MSPVRVQRKRTKGWRVPANTVYVGRPSKWGNPFNTDVGRQMAVDLFRVHALLAMDLAPSRIRAELAGKNLACWCPLDQPCHADLLLEIANSPEHKVTSTDEPVNLVGGGQTMGTVARCTCGWKSSWWIRDGSAECDGHMHMRASDPEYRAMDDERERVWAAEHAERAAKAEAERLERLANTPLGPERKPPPPRERCHGCACHFYPPCSPCENCRHGSGDVTDCDNDCQTCEEDHDY